VSDVLKGESMRITSKGQVTIPAAIRKQASLLPHMEVDFEFDGKVVTIVPAVRGKKPGRGARIVAHLRARRGDISMGTDEIMALMRGE
jgi:bifunctional DNA-binding transcriptional regulator/antitoxin component of YhaV-PrlF toxin-antitoxin module